LNRDTVAHLSTNRARRRLTSLIEANALTTTPYHHTVQIRLYTGPHASYDIVPMLLYGLEACPLSKSDRSSLDFATDWFFTKLFQTSSINIVRLCQTFLNFELPSVWWEKRVAKLEQ